MSTIDKTWQIPSGLTPKAKRAAEIIRNYCHEHGIANTGGCTVFYSPAAWRQRGEKYGRDSLLIVVHDGGDHKQAISLDVGYYKEKHFEDLLEELREIGVYLEQCTGWYSAVYEI